MEKPMTAYPIEMFSRDLITQNVEQGLGYVLGQLTSTDLAMIVAMVKEQYLHTIQCLAPNKVGHYQQSCISDYHNIHHEDDFSHQQSWKKTTRVLGPAAVETINQSELWQKLNNIFGDFLVSDEEHFGWPNIYWRLVRPGDNDIGPIHADKWFWDLGHGDMPDGYRRLKIWIAIYTEAGKNGLRVVPQSHKNIDWRFHGEVKDGLKKPVIDEKEEDLNIVDLPLSAGEFVIFHDELLHGGMPNKGESSRVSLEFTLLIPEVIGV